MTKVQRDVLERMRDGWVIVGMWTRGFYLKKDGEPFRHVATATMISLIKRDLIRTDLTRRAWVLA